MHYQKSAIKYSGIMDYICKQELAGSGPELKIRYIKSAFGTFRSNVAVSPQNPHGGQGVFHIGEEFLFKPFPHMGHSL